MFSSRDAFENDFCPVRDELLGEMYRANENGLPNWWRASLPRSGPCWRCSAIAEAICTRWRSAIAASCNERELILFGGRVGSDPLRAFPRSAGGALGVVIAYGHRKPITLSTKPLSTFSPIEDELDDDFAEAVTA